MFINYFESGFNIADAIAEHLRIISNAPSSLEAANAQIQPKERTVRYWYEEWRENKFGSKDGLDRIEVYYTIYCSLSFSFKSTIKNKKRTRGGAVIF